MTMPAEIVVIANPASGRRKAGALAEAATARLRAAGRATELLRTERSGDAERFAREALASGAKLLVGCGGDGTLQEIARVLAGGEAELGILPGGRCNDLARALGIGRQDALDDLVATLLEGSARAIDLGAWSRDGAPRRVFCTVATLGFDTEVTKYVLNHRFPVKGTAEYLHAVMRVLARFRPPAVRLRGDFGTWEGRILLAATGNTSSYGGAMRICPGAEPDDGLLDVCVVGEVGRLALLRILPRVFKGGHVAHHAVKMLKTKALEIEALEGPLDLCADGEMLGETPCRLEVMHRALRVRTRAL